VSFDGLEDILLIVLDLELPQDLEVFLLEALMTMVLFLVLDVIDHPWNITFGIGECAIALLPGEPASNKALLVDPSRGILLHYVASIRKGTA
jgi:hypothetical protein